METEAPTALELVLVGVAQWGGAFVYKWLVGLRGKARLGKFTPLVTIVIAGLAGVLGVEEMLQPEWMLAQSGVVVGIHSTMKNFVQGFKGGGGQ
jgi:hypothetical protein